MKIIKAWGGFIDGELDGWPVFGDAIQDNDLYAVFPTKRQAELRYTDVRRVEIQVPD